jgi:hypothetical protein
MGSCWFDFGPRVAICLHGESRRSSRRSLLKPGNELLLLSLIISSESVVLRWGTHNKETPRCVASDTITLFPRPWTLQNTSPWLSRME